MHKSDSIHKLLEWGSILPGFQHKFPGSSVVKNPPANVGDEGDLPSQGWEDPLVKGTAALSSILAWRIPWTEETGRLQSTGSRESDTTEAN